MCLERLNAKAWLLLSIIPILLCEFTIWEVLISELYWDEQEGKSVKLLNENQPFYITHATQPI